METVIYMIVHLGLPLLLLADVLFRKGRSKMGTLTRGFSYLMVLAFLFLWGQWAIVGSYYLRWVMVLFMLVCLWRIKVDLKKKYPFFPSLLVSRILNVTGLLPASLFAYLVLEAHHGRFYPQQGVEWSFPLGPGIYYVSSGGSNRVLNNHIHGTMTSQYFALDINKLGPLLGVSKRHICKGS